MSGHTPGPWNLDEHIHVSHDGGRHGYSEVSGTRAFWIARVQRFMDGLIDKASPEYLANARLIAAAPELLEALKQMIESAYPHPVEHPTMTAAWARAKEAIAKAEGSR